MVEDFVDDLRLENIGKIFDFEGSYNKYIIGVSKKNEEEQNTWDILSIFQ